MKKVIFILITLVIVGLTTWVVVWQINDYSTNKGVILSQTYQGRLYLNQQDYTQFKKYLADNPEIKIQAMEVLSSPDALIDFELVAYNGEQIPYGDITDTNYKMIFVKIVWVCMSVGLLGLVLVINQIKG